MPFVKKVHKRTKQGYKTYLYLARNYREDGMIKQQIIRPLAPEEAQELQQGRLLLSTLSETPPLSHAELEQLRIENALLHHESLQMEAEKRDLVLKNTRLEMELRKAKSWGKARHEQPVKAAETSPSSREKKQASKKKKSKIQKTTLQQYLSS